MCLLDDILQMQNEAGSNIATSLSILIFVWSGFFSLYCGTYRPFQKTLPKSSLQMHWISVRFYEMDDMIFAFFLNLLKNLIYAREENIKIVIFFSYCNISHPYMYVHIAYDVKLISLFPTMYTYNGKR